MPGGVGRQISPNAAALASGASAMGAPEPGLDTRNLMASLTGGQIGAEQILLLLALLSGQGGLGGLGAGAAPQPQASSPIEEALLAQGAGGIPIG